jgi:hypothetical protein
VVGGEASLNVITVAAAVAAAILKSLGFAVADVSYLTTFSSRRVSPFLQT